MKCENNIRALHVSEDELLALPALATAAIYLATRHHGRSARRVGLGRHHPI